jgi:hypothetical protein
MNTNEELKTHFAIAEKLNGELTSLNEELRATVRAGVDATKIRRRIETVEADLAETFNRASACEAETKQRVAHKVAQNAAQISSAVSKRISDALTPFHIEDTPMPTIEQHATYVDNAAVYVAAAQAELERANEVHAVAAAEVRALQARIDEAEARRTSITANRLAGKSNQGDAAEFVALGADLEVLHRMFNDADSFADSLAPVEQRAALSQANEALRGAEAEAVFAGLTARVAAIESTLIGAVRALSDAGKVLGHFHLSVSYRSSDELRRLIQLGVL